MLLLADRGFYGFALWQQAAATGADLLWRARAEHDSLATIEMLADGSWLAELRLSATPGRHAEPSSSGSSTTPIDDGRDDDDGTYRLFTTMLDPAEATADRARRRLRPAVGDRVRLRRAQDPPARRPDGAALEVPRPRAAGDLGTPVLPLRDPHPDVRSRRRRRRRPRPGQLRRRPAHHPPLALTGARFSPLRALTTAGRHALDPALPPAQPDPPTPIQPAR